MTRWIAAAGLLTLSTTALAGPNDVDKRDIRFAPITEIEFRGVDLEGKIVKPAVRLVDNRTGLVFESMVKPRVDFVPEMRASIDEIK